MTMLKGKIIIKGNIQLLSGLHIGGSQSVLDIGSIDNTVIKTHEGVPYIPGSSLKGKLRNMLARAAGSQCVDSDIALEKDGKDGEIKYIAKVFGTPENREENKGAEALLKVHDCFLKDESSKEVLEIKTENSIKRLTGEANPRALERITVGNTFSLHMTMDVYEEEEVVNDYLTELALAIKLLELDHLGGGGSRGNGRVKFAIEETRYYKLMNLKLGSDSSPMNDILKEFATTVNSELE